MSKIYVLHENSEWTVLLTKRLEELGLPYEELFLDQGIVNLTEEPPKGVFYNRISASSHTRNHRYAPELTASYIAWLEQHDRVVLNGTRALQLEISKVAQYTALTKLGIKTPDTIAAVGKNEIIKAAEKMNGKPFITKHNRAGKGLGVRLFQTVESLKDYVLSDDFEDSIDGITLIQHYIKSPDQSITRCEFIGGKFLYAVKVDTSEGFELCPADVCQVNDSFCPVGEEDELKPKFEIIQNFHHPIIKKYESFLAENKITFAGIEFILDEFGEIYTYDVNTNTNYNSDAEEAAGTFAMLEMAKYLGSELKVTI